MLKEKMNKKKRNGFTLVEMVMVITILGILSSMALIKYSKAQKNAQLNADYITAANIATATTMYLNEENINDKDKVDIKELKEKGYLATLPKAQSINGNFEIIVESDESGERQVKVNLNKTQFYPRDDEKQAS